MNKIIILAILFMFGNPLSMQAQLNTVWLRTFQGSGVPRNIALSANGSVAGVGTFYGSVSLDTFFIQAVAGGGHDGFYFLLQPDGLSAMLGRAGGQGEDYLHGVLVDDIAVYVAGVLYNAGSLQTMDTTVALIAAGMDDVFISKINFDKTVSWLVQPKSVDLEAISTTGLLQLSNGNLLMVGSFGSMDSSSHLYLEHDTLTALTNKTDLFLAEINRSTGVSKNIKRAGGAGFELGAGTVGGPLHTYVAVNYTGINCVFDNDTLAQSSLGSGVFITKLDTNQNAVWITGFNASLGADAGGSLMSIDPDENLTLYGDLYSGMLFCQGQIIGQSIGDCDMFLVHFDSSGTFKWSRMMGGPSTDYSGGISADSAGNVYATGSFNYLAYFGPDTIATYTNTPKAFIVKYSEQGNYQWTWTPGGSGYSQINAIRVSPSGQELWIAGEYTGELVLGSESLYNPSSNPTTFVAKLSQDSASGTGSTPAAIHTLRVSPNPVKDACTVYFEAVHYERLYVTDAMGSSVAAFAVQPGQGLVQLSTGGWPAGVYVLRATGQQGSGTIKLVVQ